MVLVAFLLEPPLVVAIRVIDAVVIVGSVLPGAILLLRRKPAGRVLVMVGSAVAFAAVVASSAFDVLGDPELSRAFGVGFIEEMYVMVLPAMAALVLAALPATGQWCAPTAGQSRIPAQYPGFRPPYQR